MFGQMYHHFHNDKLHLRGQGSIDAETFRAVLDNTDAMGEILEPETFANRVDTGTLQPGQTCITFDDALLCQYDIAVPVMQEKGVRGFFFVYSSVLDDEPDPLEFYRDFRNTFFDGVEDFYMAFFTEIAEQYPKLYKKCKRSFPEDYLSKFVFYTENDRRFRFFRDQIAGQEMYRKIMDAMLDSAGYDKKRRARELFMGPAELRQLAKSGHQIGLHSNSHPTRMDTLPVDIQYKEYYRNKMVLEEIIGRPIWSMSHPCGKYNEDTLQVLKKLGITLGFRQSLHDPIIRSALEVPRENHTNLVNPLQN